MNKEARNMPDKGHSFVELHKLWKQGTYTIEECITQVLHTLIRFERRKNRLDMKLLQYRPSEEEMETLKSYQSLQVEAESKQLLEAMQADKSMAYQAMDFALEHFATLEMSFLQIERECETMLQLLDEKRSYLN